MTKSELIRAILDESKIHHNISPSGLKLPTPPDDCPDNIFWDTCEMLVSDFCGNWMFEPINDSGNRNLCGCRKDNPQNILSSGACRVHDLYHCYTAGRMRATLYWDKYWKEIQDSIYFSYESEELKEKTMPELSEIYKEVRKFNGEVTDMLSMLPEQLEYEYKEWSNRKKLEARREALGYNKTLGSLLEDENSQIVRLAKGIKKELNK